MSQKTRHILIGIAVVLALATVVFIFSNSAQAADASWRGSNAIAALVHPILGGVYDVFQKVCSSAGAPTTLTYEAFVRKVAHLSEYGLLGFECCIITVALAERAVSPYLWADLFICLMVAVLDEFAQSFIGRTSVVSDVLVDFTGSLVGIGLALITAAVVLRVLRQRRA